LEFNVPCQHKYGYIRDEKIGGKLVLVTNRKSICTKIGDLE